MSQDKIAVMDGGKCILQVRGARPFFSDKFDITKHPRYKFLSDFDKKNEFDIEKYLKRRPVPLPMPAAVGSAVYDYLTMERPLSEEAYMLEDGMNIIQISFLLGHLRANRICHKIFRVQ